MKFRKLLLLLPLLAAAGCVAGHHDNAVYPADSGSRNVRAELKVGDAIVFELEQNPATGYTWSCVNNQRVCEVTMTDLPPENLELCGAPGKCKVEIRALAPGKTNAIFRYRRSWEPAEPPASELVYELNIEK